MPTCSTSLVNWTTEKRYDVCFVNERMNLTELLYSAQPLGELNWLLTIIVETIAWQTLPVDRFRKFFRSNIVLLTLAKGFVVA